MEGGRAKPGLAIKLQTEILEKPMVMSGVIKGVTYKQSTNVSFLHIQGITTTPAMKNLILTYVYGIFKDPAGKVSRQPLPPSPPTVPPPDSESESS